MYLDNTINALLYLLQHVLDGALFGRVTDLSQLDVTPQSPVITQQGEESVTAHAHYLEIDQTISVIL